MLQSQRLFTYQVSSDRSRVQPRKEQTPPSPHQQPVLATPLPTYSIPRLSRRRPFWWRINTRSPITRWHVGIHRLLQLNPILTIAIPIVVVPIGRRRRLVAVEAGVDGLAILRRRAGGGLVRLLLFGLGLLVLVRIVVHGAMVSGHPAGAVARVQAVLLAAAGVESADWGSEC